jgi:Uma2 family endonuclease
MAPQTATRMTVEEFLSLPDDGINRELINGEVVVNPAPVPLHQIVAGNIVFAFKLFLREQGGGIVFSAPLDVRLGGEVLQPDVVLICRNRELIAGSKKIAFPPDLVVEVLSDGTRRRDEIEKRKIYDHSGVGEYWIADPEIELVKIYRRVQDAFQRVAELSTETGGTITTPLLPSFTLDVRDVFDFSMLTK